VHPSGQAVSAPPPVSGIQVAAADGIVHVQLSDGTAPVHKSVNYYIETSTTSSFDQPHVFHLGPSRTFRQTVGSASPIYVRGYSQYPGGPASTPIVHGGKVPTMVNPGGVAGPAWLPSTGSGATSCDGQSGGQGSGTASMRLGPDGRTPSL
jgi:hypothetical protein